MPCPAWTGSKIWRFEVDREQIAWAIFDREGESANSLGQRPLEELGRIIEHAEAKQGELAGLIIISGKSKGFIVGADIREFDQLDTEAKVKEAVTSVNAMLDRLEAFKIPTVCAIHGNCLGGGLELALACSYRIATRADETRIAFPEVKLGIFPGFNGTARSIRQAGAVAAMQAMLTGRMIRASAARAMGLIDELVPNPERLRWAARKAVVQKRRSKPEPMTKRVMRQWPARGVIAKKMRTETAKKAREDHYPAPFRLIDLFETHGGDLNAMKRAETDAFAPLMVSDTARNLRRVFALSEEMKALAPKGLDWKPLRVHVIGAGVMGADIAGWCVASGMQASLQDLSAEQIEKGIKAQAKLFKRKFRTPAARAAAEARLIADPDGEHVARADVVIEAMVEKLEVKRQIFKDLENKMKPGAVMATNTSSIMIEDIAEGLDDPGRLIGIHFFNPVAQMPLVEVIRGKASAESEIDKGCSLRHRDLEVPADREKRAGVSRQPRARALHVRGLQAPRGRDAEREARRSSRRLRHADGPDRAGRHRWPRRLRARRRHPDRCNRRQPACRQREGWPPRQEVRPGLLRLEGRQAGTRPRRSLRRANWKRWAANWSSRWSTKRAAAATKASWQAPTWSMPASSSAPASPRSAAARCITAKAGNNTIPALHRARQPNERPLAAP